MERQPSISPEIVDFMTIRPDQIIQDILFLVHLHFSAEELLLYPPVSVSTYKMLGQMLKSFCISSCILVLFIILMNSLTTKAHLRSASSDFGTSGCPVC